MQLGASVHGEPEGPLLVEETWQGHEVCTGGVHRDLEAAHHDLFGTVLVAKRSFRKGECVLREVPLVVVSSPWGLKEKLKSADVYVHNAVMSMCFCPVIGRGTKQKELKRDASSVLTLGAILSSNGHAYNPPAGLDQECDLFALYHLGSKAQHSCAPNTAYRNAAGMLIYTAITDISKGSIITFSYCLDWMELLLPTHRRQALIKERRNFDCACERCEDEDHIRRVLCGSCATGHKTPDIPKIEDSSWSCRVCNAKCSGEGLRVEREISDAVMQIRSTDDTSIILQSYEDCNLKLGAMHWATAKYCYTLALAFAKSGQQQGHADVLRYYNQFRDFLETSGLASLTPTIYHVLTIHLCDSGALPAEQVASLYREVLPLYQAIHGASPAVEQMVRTLGGASRAARICRGCGINAFWEHSPATLPAGSAAFGSGGNGLMDNARSSKACWVVSGAFLTIIALLVRGRRLRGPSSSLMPHFRLWH